MRYRRWLADPARTFVVACVTSFGLGGCGGDSRTSGTMLQLSPEAKEAQADMKEAMKEQRRERQAERKARGKRGARVAPGAAPPAAKPSR